MLRTLEEDMVGCYSLGDELVRRLFLLLSPHEILSADASTLFDLSSLLSFLPSFSHDEQAVSDLHIIAWLCRLVYALPKILFSPNSS